MTKGAAAGALLLLLASPSFAQSRDDKNHDDSDRTWQEDRDGDRDDDRSDDRDWNKDRDRGGYRENQRVTLSGQVTSFERERNGYRVQLDESEESFWVPEATFGNRARDLRSGISISLGGIFRGGMIHVDVVSWPNNNGNDRNDRGYDRDDRGYDRRSNFVRGVVTRVDFRSDMVWLRDESSGRLIAAEMRDGGRRGGINMRRLRRGDYLELTGQWHRGDVFVVRHANKLRNRRY